MMFDRGPVSRTPPLHSQALFCEGLSAFGVSRMAKILLATGLIVGYGYFTEVFIG
jgi:hypothetical protein